MNERFFELPSEKQTMILNAAMSVFAANGYKKASTDEIAKRAGISKALLFHYFENKKGLYLFLYKYACDFTIKGMSADHDFTLTDFFDILVSAQMSKIKLLHVYPDIMNFIKNAYLEEDETVKDELDLRFRDIIAGSSERFLSRADASKLRVPPDKALNVIIWMADGFMRSRTPEQLRDLDRLNDEYIDYMEFLRQLFYKEEFLDGGRKI